jgi:hypothetical protein
MGLKPRKNRSGKTAADVVTEWMGENEGRPAHAYDREANGIRILMFVSGDEIDADNGLGLGVLAAISSDITN